MSPRTYVPLAYVYVCKTCVSMCKAMSTCENCVYMCLRGAYMCKTVPSMLKCANMSKNVSTYVKLSLHV